MIARPSRARFAFACSIARPITAIMSSARTGFGRNADAPAVKHASPRTRSDDTMTTGMSRSSGSACIVRSTSSPGMPGIDRSSNTAAGLIRRTSSSPRVPSVAVVTA
jgi:hypothetical protein